MARMTANMPAVRMMTSSGHAAHVLRWWPTAPGTGSPGRPSAQSPIVAGHLLTRYWSPYWLVLLAVAGCSYLAGLAAAWWQLLGVWVSGRSWRMAVSP